MSARDWYTSTRADERDSTYVISRIDEAFAHNRRPMQSAPSRATINAGPLLDGRIHNSLHPGRHRMTPVVDRNCGERRGQRRRASRSPAACSADRLLHCRLSCVRRRNTGPVGRSCQSGRCGSPAQSPGPGRVIGSPDTPRRSRSSLYRSLGSGSPRCSDSGRSHSAGQSSSAPRHCTSGRHPC